ncbi:hypothetical protein [Dietzia sp. MNB45]|uniref:hypothetical protein n=1 Tax=Dietzia sp. MNB45 TaxID=3238800 RepID=UPI003F7D93F6
MSTKITADNGAEIKVGQLGITVDHPEGIASIWARLSPEQRRALADALNPDHGGQWTRDDLPSVMDLVKASVDATAIDPSGGADAALDAVVAHLNAHHPKPEPDRWRRAHSIMEQERDQARESLRRLRDETDVDLFTVRDQLKQCRGEREQMTRDRDEWKARAILAEQERENWRITAINRATPAVTHADVEKVLDTGIRGATDGGLIDQDTSIPSGECVRLAVDAVCDLFGIEAEQAVDPVEEQTDALADILYGHEMVTDQMRGVLERVVRAGMLLPEQEAGSDE